MARSLAADVDAALTPHSAQRRRLVNAGVSIAASMVLPPLDSRSRVVQVPLGLELITVLPLLAANFRSTLSAVAAIGYREVETLGSLGRAASDVASTLEDCGLKSTSQHLVPDDLFDVFQQWDRGVLTMPEALVHLRRGYNLNSIDRIVHQGIARAHVMGQQFLVWPVLFEEHVASRAALDALIHSFNIAGALCQREGLTFAFHNGSKAFERVGDEVAYEIILRQTDPRTVKMELDTYYAAKSGADSIAYFSRHSDRFRLVHLKDIDAEGNITDLGQGTIDFAALLKASKAAGVTHYFVEHDQAKDPIASAQACFQYVEHIR